MYQPIMIFLKSGEVGFCTLKYSDGTDLMSQVNSISMSEDVDRVEFESHLPKLDMEQLRKDMVALGQTYSSMHDCSHSGSGVKDDRQRE